MPFDPRTFGLNDAVKAGSGESLDKEGAVESPAVKVAPVAPASAPK
jgi:hypothetical protein